MCRLSQNLKIQKNLANEIRDREISEKAKNKLTAVLGKSEQSIKLTKGEAICEFFMTRISMWTLFLQCRAREPADGKKSSNHNMTERESETDSARAYVNFSDKVRHTDHIDTVHQEFRMRRPRLGFLVQQSPSNL